MAAKDTPPPLADLQGAALIDHITAIIRTDPARVSGFYGADAFRHPRPLIASALATLTFPGGRPLAPSLKRWLAFDASWLRCLGWFSSPPDTTLALAPRPLDELLEAECDCWADTFAPLSRRFSQCLLLPGSDTHQYVYAVCEPDATGEYPVLLVETGDIPYVGVIYPGFDVYMAAETGLDPSIGDSAGAIRADPRFAARMRQHADHLFHGQPGIECYDAEWDAP